MNVVAELHSLRDIHLALRERFDHLAISRATIDAAAGLADGHASHLLALRPMKHFGDISLWPTLEVAGLKMVLIEDPDALARVTSKLPRKRGAQRASIMAIAESQQQPALAGMMREIGRRGAIAANASRNPEQRRQLAQTAARSRWAHKRAGKPRKAS